MNQNRIAETLRDEDLQREIEDLVAVDPAPEFVARVRTRIVGESMHVIWPWRWTPVGIATISATVALTLIASWAHREPRVTLLSKQFVDGAVSERMPLAVPTDSPLDPRELRARIVPPALKAGHPYDAPTRQPEVLVSPYEATALGVLVAGILDGRIDRTVLDTIQVTTALLEPSDAVVIQPIAIEPIQDSVF